MLKLHSDFRLIGKDKESKASTFNWGEELSLTLSRASVIKEKYSARTYYLTPLLHETSFVAMKSSKPIKVIYDTSLLHLSSDSVWVYSCASPLSSLKVEVLENDTEVEILLASHYIS